MKKFIFLYQRQPSTRLFQKHSRWYIPNQFVFYTFFGIISILFFSPAFKAQQNYINFEGIKFVNFGLASGVLDSLSTNPSPDSVNGSSYCAKYIRDTSLYDNIRIYPFEKLINITPYVNNTFQTPKIKMKLFTSALPGTRVELQLGSKTDDNYPSGVHSEYVAVTTVQYAWEEITFHYFQSTPESNASPGNIDKIVFLFNPNSNDRDTIYFDEIKGPELLTSSISQQESRLSFRLYQNTPNPAKEFTHFRFQLNSPGYVSLKIYDLIGNQIATVLDEELKAGSYSLPFETGNFSEGIYFYTLKKDEISRSMKMIVSK